MTPIPGQIPMTQTQVVEILPGLQAAKHLKGAGATAEAGAAGLPIMMRHLIRAEAGAEVTAEAEAGLPAVMHLVEAGTKAEAEADLLAVMHLVGAGAGADRPVTVAEAGARAEAFLLAAIQGAGAAGAGSIHVTRELYDIV